MTFFVTLSMWLAVFFAASKKFPQYRFEFLQCFHGVGATRGVVAVCCVFAVLAATTAYFLWKWLELRFRP